MKRILRWALTPVHAVWYVGTLALWSVTKWADEDAR